MLYELEDSETQIGRADSNDIVRSMLGFASPLPSPVNMLCFPVLSATEVT